MGSENISGLHSTASLGAQETFDHQASLEAKGEAIVANPIILRYSFKSVAQLMRRYGATSAEHNLIVVFILSVIADGATSVILKNNLFFLI